MKPIATIKQLAVLNLAGFTGTIVMNFLANALPLNNKTTGELSDQYPNLFVPAGFTFAIWGIIYLLLAGFSVFQATRAFISGTQKNDFIRQIGPFFFVSSLANMGWIAAWHYELLPLSLLLMLILLSSLLFIYLKLGIGITRVSGPARYLVHLPFSVYLGWITIATIANVTAVLVEARWNGFRMSEQFWAGTMIMTGTFISTLMLFRRSDIFFSIVVIWALFGIAMKRLSDSSEPSKIVFLVSVSGIVILVAILIFKITRRKSNAQ